MIVANRALCCFYAICICTYVRMYSMYMFMNPVQTYVCYFSNIYIHSSMFYNMNVVSQYHCVYISLDIQLKASLRREERLRKNRESSCISRKRRKEVCAHMGTLSCV